MWVNCNIYFCKDRRHNFEIFKRKLFIYKNTVYLIQHYVIKIKFVSDLQQGGGFLWELRFPPPIKRTANDVTEILLKVAFNMITHNPNSDMDDKSFLQTDRLQMTESLYLLVVRICIRAVWRFHWLMRSRKSKSDLIWCLMKNMNLIWLIDGLVFNANFSNISAISWRANLIWYKEGTYYKCNVHRFI